MNQGYAIVLEEGQQTGGEDSFVGGRPKLPSGVGIPDCMLCAASQTFFFQLAFPLDHAWAGHSVAVFACTACADADHLIPEMVSGPLQGANVSADFLVAYQRNFRFVVFETETGTLVATYPERVRFRPVRLAREARSSLGHVGGHPQWLMEDETPGSIASGQAVFLLQFRPNSEYETQPGAPRQMEIGLDGTPTRSTTAFYELFIGNTTYLFGPSDPAQGHVYALTQVR